MGLLTPANLTLPFAFSTLGFPAAVVLTVLMSFASTWCGLHAAALFHVGGHRCESYGAAARAALKKHGRRGRRIATTITVMQHTLNLVNSLVSVILTAQLLMSFCAHLSRSPDGSCPAMPSYVSWTVVSGAMQLAMLLVAPYPSHLIVYLAVGGVVFLFYMSVGLAVVVIQRGGWSFF